MSDSRSPGPVRLGVIGLGRRGLFCLEKWADRKEVQVVAACDRDPSARRLAESLCERVYEDPAELLGDAAIDAVLLAVPTPERGRLGALALSSGKHLVVDPPIAATVDEAERLFEAAEAAGSYTLFWTPWRDDSDFRAALGVMRSGRVGRPRIIRFERWEPMVRDHPQDPVPRAAAYLADQLVALTDERPVSVSATPFDAGLTLTVRFRHDLVALLTLHGTSSVRLGPGWAIDAERGGYAAGRRWVRTDEGELYEVPAEPLSLPSIDQKLSLAVSEGTPADSPTNALRLVALIAAASRSLETGRVEPVEPTR